MSRFAILKSLFIKELVLIFLFILTVNNYIGNSDKTISADGIGYYEYLPSIFIHHDFVRNKTKLESDTPFYQRIINLNGAYVGAFGYKIDKYPCGVALLQTPFFMGTWLLQKPTLTTEDGYQLPYHRSLFYAGVFYLFLGLVYFGKFLGTYSFKPWLQFLLQFLIVFATPLAYYTCAEPSFSHVYSFFAFCAFAYFTRNYFNTFSKTDFLWAMAFLGLILLIRQINILVLLFVPFLSENPKVFQKGIATLFTREILWMKGLLLVIGILFIQALAWYLQCGQWVLYSYREENSFNFLNPEITNILFSYQKGLFVYTPIAFISIFGLFVLAKSKRYFETITWAIAFVGITYVLSSWWCWYYGCSFGNRAYIEYLPFLLVLLGILIEKTTKIIRILLLTICFFCVPLNLVQTYQYKEFILHWVDMNKERYWKVFCKTDPQYVGLVWKKEYSFDSYELTETIPIGNLRFKSNSDTLLIEKMLDTTENTALIKIIGVHYSSLHTINNDSKIRLLVMDALSNKIVFEHYTFLNHFCDSKFNAYSEGVYNFEIPISPNPKGTKIQLLLNTNGKTETLDSMYILAWKAK